MVKKKKTLSNWMVESDEIEPKINKQLKGLTYPVLGKFE